MPHSLVEKPHSLSIRIYPGGFSFYVYGEKNHLISQKTVDIDLYKPSNISILDRQAEINRPYKRIALCCETDFFTIVPDIFTDPSHYRNLLQMQHKEVDENQAIFFEKIPQAFLLYSFPRKMVQAIQARLPEAGFYLHLMNTLKKSLDASGDQLTVYLRKKKADCLLYSKRNLVFYNSFNYESAEDVMYHVLHLTDQFHLNHERTRFVITGDEDHIRPDLLLGAYLPLVSFIPYTEEYENYQW